MGGCCALNCSHNSMNGFRMFRFPKSLHRRKLWETQVGRVRWIPTDSSRLCQEHFRSGFFLKRGSKWSLKKSAIPTVFKHSGTNAKPPRETLALSCASPPNEHAKVPDGRAIVGKEHAKVPDGRAIVGKEHAYASWTAPKSDVSPSHSIPHFAPVAKLDPLAPPSDPLAQSDTSSCGSTGDQSEETESQRLRALQNENLTLSITIRALKEKLRQEVRKNATQRARHEEAIMTSEWRFLNSDQIRYLKNGGNRGHRWRNDTMDHAQKLRLACGTSGYQALLDLGYPLPGLRRIQKFMESVKCESGIPDEAVELLEPKVEIATAQE